ncbi:hypothetical protein [Ancylobacter rudongensis]|jgi:hypothetical protein|uniref:UrcA family protein n=1 Tax=Ancylobacter rudongensis TaxID=177413 RepID=A0A1G4UR94_9HYPH|nr:hypothetical protein [Ancylobacter rudongensis]RTL97386.1 hypothetical protein EJV44_08690 [Ancylobacter aquaticus]SCW96162.1 hypothetical protein SAMN05660859_0180 [Ancylobacter rudongensis]
MMLRSFARVGGLSTAACAALVLLASGAARADQAAGNACAASLNADGKAIYSAVMAAGDSGDLRTIVTDTTKSLAMSGQIDRGNARANAQAAAQCLEQARS